LLALPQLGGNQAVVEITLAADFGLAASLVDRRRDARELPLAIDKLFALVPAPAPVVGGGPVHRRRSVCERRLLRRPHGGCGQVVEAVNPQLVRHAEKAEAEPECELAAVHAQL
jgi:hypothetical protein